MGVEVWVRYMALVAARYEKSNSLFVVSLTFGLFSYHRKVIYSPTSITRQLNHCLCQENKHISNIIVGCDATAAQTHPTCEFLVGPIWALKFGFRHQLHPIEEMLSKSGFELGFETQVDRSLFSSMFGAHCVFSCLRW